MKAIDTLYKGNYFRSRLEARWALFFDGIGVRWEYEAEGYDLGDGVKYLPDFWFPDHRMYGEVKPSERLNDTEMEKIKRLAQQSRRPIILFAGPPSLTKFLIYEWYNDGFAFEQSPDNEYRVIPFGGNLLGDDKYDPYFWDCSGYEYDPTGPWAKAVYIAQTKRFEHGQ